MKNAMMRSHFTLVRIAIIKSPQINAGESVERREPSCTVGGDVNWSSHYAKQYGGSSKKKKRPGIRGKRERTRGQLGVWD